MKCFILKTQDDLSIALCERCLLPATARATPPVGRAGLPASPASEASRHSSWEEPLLSSYPVCGLEVNVETFLGIYLSVPVWLSLPEPFAGLE